jgi:orotate phosphoribosyltransferase
LIIDDVITAGTSVRESVEIIKAANATPSGVLIALDRQEKGLGDISAIQEVTERFALPVTAIISLSDIIDYLKIKGETEHLATIQAYQVRYGI